MKFHPLKTLLNPLERLITEHGSAAIQEKHIALLKEQFSILEKEKVKFTTENSELKSKVGILESKIQVLESEKQALITENENLRKKIEANDQWHHNIENPPEDYNPLTHGLKK